MKTTGSFSAVSCSGVNIEVHLVCFVFLARAY